jgi:hypothetical protein
MMLMDTCWELAQRWYAGRLERDWWRPASKEIQALFEELGLVGEFWRIIGG